MTAPITRQTLLETLQAFKRTAVLRAAIRLRIYDALAAGPTTPEKVAVELGLDERGTRILLGTMASQGLLDSDGVTYSAPEGAETLLVSTSPQYAGGAAKLVAADWEWSAMLDLADTVRNGHAGAHAGLTEPDLPYWVDFAADSTFVAAATCKQFLATTADWAEGRDALDVLDLGCGNALFGCEFARTHSAARVVALDWASVLPAVTAQAARSGVAHRVRTVAGDAFTADLGGPYDLVVLANLLPMFDRERGVELLRRVAAVVAPGGRVVLTGFATGELPPAREHAAHGLSLMMLAGTAGGEAHPLAAYREMFARAGFEVETEDRVGELPVHVVLARRAANP
ncbi:class I SAM-dependent methyltransferase [Actinokineospora enzanensis]|uniref:class I SAM-dependent methyltransferase n=1 Tax=Actinokineospora enzanensis TaxID=155975 RepID=UPI000361EDFA|nr:class I SAM-dependent methyltransferase [Actinokineospora enzanensis]